MCAAVAVVTSAGPSAAAEGDYDLFLPQGLACSDFALGIDISGTVPKTHDFYDRDGNLVRSISAGNGQALTFTNDATGESVDFRSNGSVTRTVYNQDGTRTVTALGHNVIILFPSDTPAGPSTKLHSRIVYRADADNNFTVLSTAGRTTDICALLSD
jgi:hypothetical protein